MEAISEQIPPGRTPALGDYKSRPGALIWSFRKSRDRWKSKYQQLKASVKGYKNRLADLTKSRRLWKLKAKLAEDRVATLQAELAGLRAEVETQAEPSGGKNPAG
jgi:hypothetical protein